MINLVYGPGASIGDPALASEHLAGVHFTGSTGVFNSIWKTVGENIASGTYRNYPRIVGETGGKDFIVAHPSADVDAVATAIVRGSFEYQGQKCSAASRVYAPVEPLAGAARAARRAGRRRSRWATSPTSRTSWAPSSTRSRSRRRRRRSTRRARTSETEVLVGGGVNDEEGFFVEPTVIETRDPDFRLLRDELFGPGRDRVRLSRGQVERHARARRPHRSVRPDRRRLRRRPARVARGRGRAPLRGRQLLRERQADRGGRRPAAVRRRARVGHERQGRLDVEPDPLGEPADDQGDVRPADGLPLPVHGARPRRERRHAVRRAAAAGTYAASVAVP